LTVSANRDPIKQLAAYHLDIDWPFWSIRKNKNFGEGGIKDCGCSTFVVDKGRAVAESESGMSRSERGPRPEIRAEE
jgi:hypothetical protein